ncbi:MAG: hypothetical protein V4591_01195 [Bdellovibrionota bacterium]
MKKKLSNSKHIHWIIAFVASIGLGYLFILIEFVKMHDRRVLFYNLKTVNLNSKPNAIVYDKNSPIFVVHKDKVIFGTVQSIVLPKLEKDSLVLSKISFQEQFKDRINKYKNVKSIFPAKVVGISFQDNLNYSEKLKMISNISILIRNENKKINHNIIPSVVFIDTLPAI